MEQKAWNAKRVGMVLLALVMAASALLFATGCSSQSNQKESSDPITMVWLPDNSSADLTQSREAIGDVIKEATGRGVESSDDLLQDGAFFGKVMFGDSHQGSAVNLLSGQSDAAAFDDVDVDMYLDLVSGTANTPGAVYKVKDDAAAPFDSACGKEFTIIGITPVLNAPFCYNTDKLSDDEQKKITEAFCSEETASNKEIFADPDDENAKAIFDKDSDKTCFVACDDAWYNPIRELGA